MFLFDMVTTVIKCFLGFKKTNKVQKEVFQTDSMQCLKSESELNLKLAMSIQQTNNESKNSQCLSLVLLSISLFCVISEALFCLKKKKKKLTYLQSIHHVQEQHNVMGHKTDQQTNSIVKIANLTNLSMILKG